MADLFDQFVMGHGGPEVPIGMPQNHEDAEDALGEPAQATQRITDAQKTAVHEHFLDERAESWTSSQKRDGLAPSTEEEGIHTVNSTLSAADKTGM